MILIAQYITSILFVEKHKKNSFAGLTKKFKNSVFNFGLSKIISKGKTRDMAVNSNGRKTNNLECLDPYFSNNPPIEINVKSNAVPIDTVYFVLDELATVVKPDSHLTVLSL